MAFSLRNALSSSSKRSSSSSRKNDDLSSLLPRYEKLSESSSASSIFSADEHSTEEAKQKAYQARRAREAEEYLYKYGFGGSTSTNPRV